VDGLHFGRSATKRRPPETNRRTPRDAAGRGRDDTSAKSGDTRCRDCSGGPAGDRRTSWTPTVLLMRLPMGITASRIPSPSGWKVTLYVLCRSTPRIDGVASSHRLSILETIGWQIRQTPDRVGRRLLAAMRRRLRRVHKVSRKLVTATADGWATELYICAGNTDVSIAGGPAKTVPRFQGPAARDFSAESACQHEESADSLRFSTTRHGVKEDTDAAMSGFQDKNRVEYQYCRRGAVRRYSQVFVQRSYGLTPPVAADSSSANIWLS